jgi:rod shape-determining protein MreB
VWNPIDALLGLFSLDIGIDLGTATTLVCVRGKGIVIHEPSWVAIDRRTRRVLAVGEAAKEMVGRTPAHIVAIRPLRDGVISEFEVTREMIGEFIRKAHQQVPVPVPRPRVVVGIPSGVTEVERRAVHDACLAAGARAAFLIEEPLAAAIGIGLPVAEARGSMVVDIGGGTTEVAVFALGGIVVGRSVRVAGDEMDEAIINYMRQRYNLLIGERMAERVKIEIGSAYPLPEERTMVVRGRNLVTGLPDAFEVSSIEIREALRDVVSIIVDTVKSVLDETPPELVADIMETGIAVVGGGAQLKGLAQRLTEETRIRCWVPPDPVSAVAMGAARVLEDLDTWNQVLTSLDRGRPARSPVRIGQPIAR